MKSKIGTVCAVLILVLVCLGAHAQTWVPIADENDTIAIGSMPVTLQLGVPAGTPVTDAGSVPCTTVGGCWETLVLSSGPLVTITATVTTFGGVDPAFGTAKIVQVEQTNLEQLFQVTNNGSATELEQGISIAPGATETVIVPGTFSPPAAATCSAPTASNPNPAVPSTPLGCAPLANEVAVAGDGSTITNLEVATPVIFQYCTGSGGGQICDAPFMFDKLPIVVGPNAQCGGPTALNSSAPGTLYIVEAIEQNTVLFSAASGGAPQSLVVAANAGP
jgi:hypothetical protein